MPLNKETNQTNQLKFNKPWYNNECTMPHSENSKQTQQKSLEFFKNCRARAQRTIKESE